MDSERILKSAVDNGEMDVHQRCASPPMLRLGSQSRVFEGLALTYDDMLSRMGSRAPKRFSEDIAGQRPASQWLVLAGLQPAAARELSRWRVAAWDAMLPS